jgi:predicted phosphodiesterase
VAHNLNRAALAVEHEVDRLRRRQRGLDLHSFCASLAQRARRLQRRRYVLVSSAAELPSRIGLIGDVHAEDELLRLALEHFARIGIDTILCTGDVVDGEGSAQRCCELLQEWGVLTVRGNHDRWFLNGEMRRLGDATLPGQLDTRALGFLSALPALREFSTSQGPLLLCHGLGANDMAKVGPDDFGYALDANVDLQKLLRERRHRWVVNGHSHRPMQRRFGELCVINAGTLLRHHSPCLVQLDLAAGALEIVRLS